MLEQSTSRWVEGLRRTTARLSSVSGAVAALALVVMAFHIAAEVVARKVFGGGLPGTLDQITYWWMPAIALLGLSYSELLREHPRVTLLLPAGGTKRRRLADVFSILCSTAVCALLLQVSIGGARESFEIKEKAVGIVTVPIWPAKILVVVGLALFLLQLLIHLVLAIRGEMKAEDEFVNEEEGLVDVAG